MEIWILVVQLGLTGLSGILLVVVQSSFDKSKLRMTNAHEIEMEGLRSENEDYEAKYNQTVEYVQALECKIDLMEERMNNQIKELQGDIDDYLSNYTNNLKTLALTSQCTKELTNLVITMAESMAASEKYEGPVNDMLRAYRLFQRSTLSSQLEVDNFNFDKNRHGK